MTERSRVQFLLPLNSFSSEPDTLKLFHASALINRIKMEVKISLRLFVWGSNRLKKQQSAAKYNLTNS